MVQSWLRRHRINWLILLTSMEEMMWVCSLRLWMQHLIRLYRPLFLRSILLQKNQIKNQILCFRITKSLVWIVVNHLARWIITMTRAQLVQQPMVRLVRLKDIRLMAWIFNASFMTRWIMVWRGNFCPISTKNSTTHRDRIGFRNQMPTCNNSKVFTNREIQATSMVKNQARLN